MKLDSSVRWNDDKGWGSTRTFVEVTKDGNYEMRIEPANGEAGKR